MDLKSLIFDSPESDLPKFSKSEQICGLKKNCPRCHSKGYERIVKNGLVEAALCDCVQNCKECFGRGRLLNGKKSASCQNPHPTKIVKLYKNSGVPSRYKNSALAKIINQSNFPKGIVNSLKKWCKNPVGSKGKLFQGPVGVGKTYFLTSLTFELISNGISASFVDFFQLLNILKKAYSEDKSDDHILRPLLNVDVLIIDELGKGRSSDWELTVLDHLIMGRYNADKTLLASTNYHSDDRKRTLGSSKKAFDDLALHLEDKVGQRIYSRLVEMCDFVSLGEENLRKGY